MATTAHRRGRTGADIHNDTQRGLLTHDEHIKAQGGWTGQDIRRSTDKHQRLPRQPSTPILTMKFSLALVLVSLSVLTAAKHEFVRKSKPYSGQQGGNGTPSSGQQGGNGAPSSVAPANAGTPAKSQPEATPSGYNPKTGSTTGKSSSGWVQNPSGSASFSARSGCQSPCKSWFTLSSLLPTERNILLQRAARK